MVRNIGIVAHIDAGKTTLTEQLLFLAGVVRHPGAVEDGSTVADWMVQEQERGITIGTAAVTCRWGGEIVNLVDTPGHVDFTLEVERSLTVLDGVVVVLSGPDGVQAQTQTVWHQAARRSVPVLGFVNKLDRPGFDDTALQEDIRERLGIEPLPLQVPIEFGGDRVVVLDVLGRERLTWEGVTERGKARAPVREPVEDEDELLEIEIATERIVDVVSQVDDAFAETVLGGGTPEPAAWTAALARAVQQRSCLPLLYGVARAGAGPTIVANAVITLLPSADESRAPKVYDLATGDEREGWRPDPERGTAAFVFKTERRGRDRRLVWLRVFQGALEAGAELTRLPGGEAWTLGPLVRLVGGWEEPIVRLGPGAIGGAIVESVESMPRTGETLAGADAVGWCLTFESVRVPTPVISVTIEAADQETDAAMRRALETLATDDPSLVTLTEPTTGATLLAGMGELHLELALERLRREFGLSVRAGAPLPRQRRIAQRAAVGEGRFRAETVPHGEVVARVRIVPHDSAGPSVLEYDPDPPARSDWRQALEAGIANALYYQADVVGAAARIEALEFHGAGLTPLAFWEAGTLAVREALASAGVGDAEPWMTLSIVVPDEHVGRVSADLARRRGRILGSHSRGVLQVLAAEAPLAELIRYATDLRSLTGGRATFTMEPAGYRPS